MMSKSINYESAQHVLTTLGDWIRFAASSFNQVGVYFGHGTDNAWDEAVQLVLGVLHLPVESDPKVFYAKLTPDESKRMVDAIRQRIESRKPVAYITHEAWCLGLPFYVDERVLIPRSPIAEWIDKQFQPWVDPHTVNHILEIGTGSGCLAVVAAMAFSHALIDAVDINVEALAVAKINVERHHVEDQINLMQSNCFSALGDARYDIIFSNPPYVGGEEMATLPKEYQHEPTSALFAEEEGLAIVIQILAQAARYLNPEGILVVEVGNSQYLLSERLSHVPFIWLEQERGGHGLFLLTKQQLDELSN